MAQLVAKCRLTGHYMYMGLEVSADELARMPDPFMRKFCPYCACEHAWHKKDAKLADRKAAPGRRILQAS